MSNLWTPYQGPDSDTIFGLTGQDLGTVSGVQRVTPYQQLVAADGVTPLIGPQASAGSLPIVPATDARFTTRRDAMVLPRITQTRPNNATTYTVAAGFPLVYGSNPAGFMTMLNAAKVAGGISEFQAILGIVKNPSNLTFKIFWFDVQPTPVADGAAWDPLAQQAPGFMEQHLVALNSMAPSIPTGLGSGEGQVVYVGSFAPAVVKCAAGDTSLYGIAALTSTYTPIALETLTILPTVFYD